MNILAAGPPHHLCMGCCADRADTVRKGAELLQCLFKAMSIPALNKWTKIFPAAGHCVLLSQLWGLGPAAFKAEFAEPSGQVSSSSEEGVVAEDANLAVPINEMKKWRRLARKRNARAMHFISDDHSKWVSFLWMLLAAPLMAVHWMLFKHATWITDRKEAKNDLLAAFCNEQANPAWKVIETLLDTLRRPDHRLEIMKYVYGPTGRWSQARKKTCRRATVIMVGQIIRKLVHPWLQWPWRLFSLVDQSLSEETRQKCAEDLLAASECCLDTWFSLRLKESTNSAEELLHPDIQDFLQMVFDRVVPSTFIERQFAAFNRWNGGTLPSLASKHVARMWKETVRGWRKRSKQKKNTSKKRPEWAKAKSLKCASRQNGYHMFVKNFKSERILAGLPTSSHGGHAEFFQAAKATWDRMTQEEKAEYSAAAKRENLIRNAVAAGNDDAPAADNAMPLQGPWGLVTAEDEWPLSDRVVEEYLQRKGGFEKAKKAWLEAHLLS